MKRDDSFITIIMATYNRAHLIEESLGSIQKQIYPNWECLIIDDGSFDSTIEVLKPFLKSDNRFRYYSRTKDYKKGLSGCRNMALDLAKGDYVIFFDDDDIVHPQNLETCLKILQKYSGNFCAYKKEPFTGAWHGNLKKIESLPDIKTIGIENLKEVITGKLGLASCTVFWEANCFETIRFNEDLMYAEEWECYSKIIIFGYRGVNIDKVLYFNRKHLHSNTGEFKLQDPIRRSSKADAAKLIILQLQDHNLISDYMIKFFIQTAFSIRNFSLLKFILERCGLKKSKILAYKLVYRFYPFIRPLFKLKAKF